MMASLLNSRRLLSLLLGTVLIFFLRQPVAVSGRNPSPFSSNVVALTARNWKREVEDSPHAVFVNICRQG